MNNTFSSIIANALTPVVSQVMKIAGKEVSKKAVITTAAVGGTAVAGGTTAAILYHNHKKKQAVNGEDILDDFGEEATEVEEYTGPVPVEQEKTEAPMQTMIDEAQVNAKIDSLKQELADRNVEYQKQIGSMISGFADTLKSFKEDIAKSISELQSPAEPAHAEAPITVDATEHVAPQPAPAPQIINPAPAGPNPVFQMMGQMPQQVMAPTLQPQATMTARDIAEGKGPSVKDAAATEIPVEVLPPIPQLQQAAGEQQPVVNVKTKKQNNKKNK